MRVDASVSKHCAVQPNVVARYRSCLRARARGEGVYDDRCVGGCRFTSIQSVHRMCILMISAELLTLYPRAHGGAENEQATTR